METKMYTHDHKRVGWEVLEWKILGSISSDFHLLEDIERSYASRSSVHFKGFLDGARLLLGMDIAFAT